MSAGLGIVLQPDTFYSAALVASSMLYTGRDWCCGTERVGLARQARELKARCLMCFTRRGFHYIVNIIFLVAMAMITLEELIDTYKGFNISKNLIITHAKCFTIDAGMASTISVTVVTSTSSHSTRRPHSTTVTQDNHIMLITLCLYVGQYGTRIVTYSSVVKLWFTLRASARAVAPESPILFHSRLWKRVLQN